MLAFSADSQLPILASRQFWQSLPCSFVSLVVNAFGFPVSRSPGFPITRCPDHPMSRSPDLFAAFCLCLSAKTPTPHKGLLKTKAKPQFDRAVTDRSKSIFSVFRRSNCDQFRPFFPAFTVRSAEGHKPLRYPSPSRLIPFHPKPSLGGRCNNLPFVRHRVKENLMEEKQ